MKINNEYTVTLKKKKTLFHFYFESQENCICCSQGSIRVSLILKRKHVPGVSTTDCFTSHAWSSVLLSGKTHVDTPRASSLDPWPLPSVALLPVPCPTVSFSPSSITHVPTRRSRLGWGAPILLVNYALCPGHAEFSTTLRQVLTLSYTILVSVVGTPRPLASVCTNCLKVKSFTPSGT